MTKDEILEYFKDVNHAHNDCTRYDTLKRMLDELQEPCEDAISRQAVIDAIFFEPLYKLGMKKRYAEEAVPAIFEKIKALPPVTPQYTDAEIQKMQDLESAEIQKAYEIGKEEGSIGADVLDKIKADLWMEGVNMTDEYQGVWVRYRDIERIIDKYKASSTGAEKE